MDIEAYVELTSVIRQTIYHLNTHKTWKDKRIGKHYFFASPKLDDFNNGKLMDIHFNTRKTRMIGCEGVASIRLKENCLDIWVDSEEERLRYEILEDVNSIASKYGFGVN